MRLGKRERRALRAVREEERLARKRGGLRLPEMRGMFDCMYPHGKPRVDWAWDYRKHMSSRKTRGRSLMQ